MARSRTSFVKGHKGGPGRPKLPEWVKKINAKYTPTFLKGMINKFGEMTYDELKEIAQDKSTPAVEAALIAQWLQAGQGELASLNFLLERSYGKVVVQEIEQADPENDKIKMLDEIPREKLIALLKE